MGRPLRIDPPDGWHHVMNRGIDHGAIFFDDADRREFGRLLGLVHARFGTEIHAYCLMGNHYHLLVRCPDGRLSDAMHLVGSLFVRFVNDRTARDGPLFKSRFHARQVTSVPHLANALRYIHLNPLDIGGVTDVADYRWSSHRTYLGLRSSPKWFSTDFFLDWFGGDRSAIDAFVTGIDRTAGLTGTADDIVTTCEFVVAEQSSSRLRARHGETRSLVLGIAADLAASQRDEVHRRLELGGGALRTAQSRSRKLIASSPELAAMRRSADLLLAA